MNEIDNVAAENTQYVVPAVTAKESADGYDYTFEVPGVGKGAADLAVEGKTLTLKTHAGHKKPEGWKYVQEEFSLREYAVSVDLPEIADPETLAANL